MHTNRFDKLRQQLKVQGVDCLALVPGANLRYLTGLNFHLLERVFIAFIPADREPVLVIPDLEVTKWEVSAPFPAHLFGWSDVHGPAEAMRQAVMALPEIHTLAVEHLRMRVMEHTLVRRYLPKATVVAGEAVMDPLRMRKDAAEVAALRRAVEIAEAALEQVVSTLKLGMTEREIANRLNMALMAGSGGTVPFEPIVLSGPRSAMPHGGPEDHAVEAGEILLIDYGTTYDGYACDITRTFVVGQEPDAKLRERYEAVQAANEAGRAAAKPGATAQDVDRAAHEAIEERGFGDYFIHRTGHGLGLDVHEPPSIMEGNQMPLDVGMVFTVEPGVYNYEDGWGGIRIEDDVVITEDGSESLTTFNRDLRVVGA